MDKSPDAFRTISEVAGDLDLPQHVLRFWETRFSQIRPLKRGGGRRYYRPDDVDLLKGIRHLLYGEGYTIRGVQRILKEEGVRFVMDVWREGAAQPARTTARMDEDPAETPSGSTRIDPGFDPGFAPSEPLAFEPPEGGEGGSSSFEEVSETPAEVASPQLDPEIRAAHVLARRFAPVHPSGRSEPPMRTAPSAPLPPAPPQPRPSEDRAAALSRDDVRRLQATLFELLECKRLLDQVR